MKSFDLNKSIKLLKQQRQKQLDIIEPESFNGLTTVTTLSTVIPNEHIIKNKIKTAVDSHDADDETPLVNCIELGVRNH